MGAQVLPPNALDDFTRRVAANRELVGAADGDTRIYEHIVFQGLSRMMRQARPPLTAPLLARASRSL